MTMSRSTHTPDIKLDQYDAGGKPGYTRPATDIVWPYCADDGPALAWWRMLPAHLFCDAERLDLRETLERLAVIDGGKDFTAALQGDPAAAIAVALTFLPIREVSFKVDIAMTVLLRCALDDAPAAALVLSHVLGRAEWEGTLATDLSTSWLTRHLCSPQDLCRRAQIQAMLSAAFPLEDA
jgi:hypothetical protein